MAAKCKNLYIYLFMCLDLALHCSFVVVVIAADTVANRLLSRSARSLSLFFFLSIELNWLLWWNYIEKDQQLSMRASARIYACICFCCAVRWIEIIISFRYVVVVVVVCVQMCASSIYLTWDRRHHNICYILWKYWCCSRVLFDGRIFLKIDL